MAERHTTAAELSDKIKQGIRRARAAGKTIGAHGHRLAAQHRAEATGRALVLLPVIEEFVRSGASFRKMVDVLNGRNEPTPSGTGRWHVKTLQRLVERAREADPLLRRSAMVIGQSRELCQTNAEVRARTEVLMARTRALRDDFNARLSLFDRLPATR